jgi:hypothetical protein
MNQDHDGMDAASSAAAAADDDDVDVDDGHNNKDMNMKPSSDSSWSPEMCSWSSSSASVSPAAEAENSADSWASLLRRERGILDGTVAVGTGSAKAAVAAATTTAASASAATTAIDSSIDSKPQATDIGIESRCTPSSSSWTSSNTATTNPNSTSSSPTTTNPNNNFHRGQNVFVTIGKADHVAQFDSFIYDVETNRPILAKVRYSSSLKWDQVGIGQLKPMHVENKDGELITPSYSKRIRYETNRYNPLPGGGTSATESKPRVVGAEKGSNAAAATTTSTTTTANDNSHAKLRGRGKRVSSSELELSTTNEDDEEVEVVVLPTYSKRTRHETNRYQPSIGKGKSCDTGAGKVAAPPPPAAAAAATVAVPRGRGLGLPRKESGRGGRVREVSSGGRQMESTRVQRKTSKGRDVDRNGRDLKGSKLQRGNEEVEEKEEEISTGGGGGGEFNNGITDANNDFDDGPEHGYYKVDEILDRRTKKVGSDINGVGMRFIVEYRECFRICSVCTTAPNVLLAWVANLIPQPILLFPIYSVIVFSRKLEETSFSQSRGCVQLRAILACG